MIKKSLFLALSSFLILSLSVFGAKTPKDYKMLQMLERAERGAYPDESIVSRYLTTPEAKLIPPNAPFYVAGYTYYDYQSNDGQRRMIANDYSGTLHFTWMDLVGNDMTNNRYIDYNALYNFTAGPDLVPGGMHVTSAVSRGGYGGMDLLPATKGGREVLCYHLTNPTTPANAFWGTVISIEKVTAGLGQFNQFDIPDSCNGYAEKGEWPTTATAKLTNGDTAFIHITHARGVTSAGNKIMGYVRCFEKPSNHDTLVCQSPGWSSPLLIPKSTKIVPNKVPFQYAVAMLGTGVIATSPVSHKVAIVWYQSWTSSQTSNELMYAESNNDGSDWIANPASFVPVQITSYQAMGGTGSSYAYDDIAAVYDYNDNLHIMWTTFKSTNMNDVTLWHWSAADGIRKAGSAFASYTTDPGAWNLIISKLTLGVEYMPADPAYNYLYLNYTKFSDGDVAANGFANGDICQIVSSNGGKSWGPEVNLTNTNTNGCSPPACSSEHWSSIAERVDSSEYVANVLDHDGGGVAESEGTFTLNEFALLKFPRLMPGLASKIDADITGLLRIRGLLEDYPCAISLPDDYTEGNVMIGNLGTCQLVGDVLSSSDIRPDILNFNIGEIGPSQNINLTFNPLHDPLYQYTAKLIGLHIKSNNYLPFCQLTPDVETTLKVVRACFPSWSPTFITEMERFKAYVSNAGLVLKDWRNLYTNREILEMLTPVFAIDRTIYPIATTYEEMVGKFGLWSKRSYPLKIEMVKSEAINIYVGADVIVDLTGLGALLEIKNKTAGLEYKWNNLNFECFIGENWFKANATIKFQWNDEQRYKRPSDYPCYFGVAADWHGENQRNTGGYNDTLNLIWVTLDGADNDYCAGILFLDAARIKDGHTYHYTSPFGAHILSRGSLENLCDSYFEDSLNHYMSAYGYSIDADSAQDLSVVMPMMMDIFDDTSTQFCMKYALLYSDRGLNDLYRQASLIKRIKPGDANFDFKVTVSDVMYMVNYLFKDGPEPWLAYNDVNGDEKVGVYDVVYLVNYLFKGGPAPCIPIWESW